MPSDDGVNDSKNEGNHGEHGGTDNHGSNSSINGRHCNKVWWTVMASVAILAMTGTMILGRISGTGISKGDSVQKNATAVFTSEMDSRAIETVVTIVTNKSPVSADEEESICGSLDDHLPLLLPILRGDEVQVGYERSTLVTHNLGCLIPFASEQRLIVSTRKNDAGAPKHLIVPGFDQELIRRAFLGKRIYFVGDSTMRTLFVALRKLLIAMNDDGDSVESLYSGWFRGIFREFQESKKQWRSEGLPPYTLNGTYLEIVDVNPLYFVPERRNRKNGTNVNGLQNDFLERLRKTLDKPDIIIFNAGMHLLHLTPMRVLRHQTYVSWVHYESLLEKLLQVGLESGASALIAKSTNRICGEKLPSDMIKFTKGYRKESSLKACQDFIEELQEKEQQQKITDESYVVLSQSQREEICKFGALDESGSSYLNERMSKWVREVHIDPTKQSVLNDDDGERDSQPSNTTRLQYFDDHDVESCEFTDEQDGRHFPRLSLVRLHLLAILLNCMMPE